MNMLNHRFTYMHTYHTKLNILGWLVCIYIYIERERARGFGVTFSIPVINLNKFAYWSIKKDKFNLLRYESAKYLYL